MPTTDMSTTDEQILAVLAVFARCDYPLSATWIAKQLSLTKKIVNGRLYALQKAKAVESLEMSPVLWRVVTSSKATPASVIASDDDTSSDAF